MKNLFNYFFLLFALIWGAFQFYFQRSPVFYRLRCIIFLKEDSLQFMLTYKKQKIVYPGIVSAGGMDEAALQKEIASAKNSCS